MYHSHMQNEPIHEIRFLKYLTTKLSEEVAASNHLLNNEQLNGIYGDIDKLIDRIEKIETKAKQFQEQHGSAITI
jgi:hypothetical protein